MKNVEFDKHYVLRSDNYYWCISIQRSVLFEGSVVVIAKKRTDNGVFDEPIWFGKLIDIGGMVDYETDVEIEFTQEDVISEYAFRKGASFHYIDFPIL